MKTEKCLVDLQLEVIYNEKCISCGSCGAFCPNIYFEEGVVKYKEQCSESVGVCYNFCPRAELDVKELDMRHFGMVRDDQALGVVKKAVKATLQDQSLRDVTNALLVAAMESQKIDTAVMADAKVDKRLEPKACSSREEIISNAGERKGLGPIVWGAGEAIRAGATQVAVVGRPCHAQGLAKIRKNPDFLVGAEKITLVIAEFCLAQGKGCTQCMDYSGEFADISIDAKTGDLLIRSDAGQAIVNTAVSKGFISISEIDTSAIRETAMKKKAKNFIKVLDKAGGKITVGHVSVGLATMKSLTKE